MASKADQISEVEIGKAALRIASDRTDGVASLALLKAELPNYLDLSAEDRIQSLTRPHEEMWEQKVRNLISHRETAGNIIAEGLAEYLPREGIRITDSGRLHVRNNP